MQSINTTTNIIVLDTLPSLFGVSTLEVRMTPGQTAIDTGSGTPGTLTVLGPNDTVSVRGPLFKGVTAPFLMAKRIRKR